jgi:hypothetical protein
MTPSSVATTRTTIRRLAPRAYGGEGFVARSTEEGDHRLEGKVTW